MAYCTRQDLINANASGFVAAMPPEAVELGIEQAQGEIDGYLFSGNYSVPLALVPANIKNYAVDIALYNIAISRGFTKDTGDEELRSKVEAARKYLRDVGLGKMQIPLLAESSAGGSEASVPKSQYFTRKGIREVDTRGYY